MKTPYPPMEGKTVLITGATSGIGLQTALQLAPLRPRIVFTYRDEVKMEHTLRLLGQYLPSEQIIPMYCRMDSLASVRDFAKTFISEHNRLDVLINNAGLWQTRREVSSDGIELTWAVNHLAPFLMTNLLLPVIKQSAPARIINVASESHRNAMLDFEDPECSRSFPMMKAYSQSKLANLLFTLKLAVELNGSGVTANALHPGVVNTPIFNPMNPLMLALFKPFTISPAKGAATSVYLAASADAEDFNGLYFRKCKAIKPSARAMNRADAERLWQLSMKYVESYY
jgi:retinol dehydrogenase 12